MRRKNLPEAFFWELHGEIFGEYSEWVLLEISVKILEESAEIIAGGIPVGGVGGAP